MKLTRPRIITIGVAAAVLAISMTSLASGVSLSKLVKKEVAKQISKATGPAGPAGAAGAPGAPKAFGAVTYTSETPTIVAAQSSGLTGVSETTTGAGSGSDGFVCVDVAVPFKTAVATPVLTAAFGVPNVSVWIPVSPGPPFTVGTCPAESDLIVLVNNPSTGSFQKGSFTIALF